MKGVGCKLEGGGPRVLWRDKSRLGTLYTPTHALKGLKYGYL